MGISVSRREMIVGVGAAAMGLLADALSSRVLAAAAPEQQGSQPFVHKLPPLPYPYDALYQCAFKNVSLIRVSSRFMLWPPMILGGSHGKDH